MKYNRIRHFGDNFKYEEVYQRCFTRKDHFELFSFCAARALVVPQQAMHGWITLRIFACSLDNLKA